MASIRIDWRRLVLIYIFTIGLPLLVGLVAEFFFDAVFSLILTAALISIPFAVFFVCRTALVEMERVVQIVAPAEEEESEPSSEDSQYLSRVLQ